MISEAAFKGAVHATAGCMFAIMGAYNLMRWCATRHRRNATNVAIYMPMAIRELGQARYHWSHPDAVPLIDVNARRA